MIYYLPTLEIDKYLSASFYVFGLNTVFLMSNEYACVLHLKITNCSSKQNKLITSPN